MARRKRKTPRRARAKKRVVETTYVRKVRQFSGSAAFHKKSGGAAENAARLKLRSVIDELERGQCPRAAGELVSAAQLIGAMQAHKNSRKSRRKGFKGKSAQLNQHLTEVTRAFERSCVKGSTATFPQRSMPVQHDWRSGLYRHAGPRGQLPGSRALGPATMPHAPSHVHPFIDGLSGVRKPRRR